jgi:Ni,Fe-hydrogenase III small subunit/formate hydrogenlyase subunit 6/NADH:ubiquinone oxidoreductase subunit I
MLRLLSYLLNRGVVTSPNLFPELEEGVRGVPKVTDSSCAGPDCNECVRVCPTDAITLLDARRDGGVRLDLGACIGCGMCSAVCPSKTIVNDSSTKTGRLSRESLIVSNEQASRLTEPDMRQVITNIYKRSIAIRVVSTGCTACDLEIGAAGNPIFDMERFGAHVVASPRFADVLLVTGPVPKAMHDPLKRCYEAMAEPRLVVAVGSCAISGGVHKNGYAEANGVGHVIPVDVYVPGCPPHPWSIIHGVHLAMTRCKASL